MHEDYPVISNRNTNVDSNKEAFDPDFTHVCNYHTVIKPQFTLIIG